MKNLVLILVLVVMVAGADVLSGTRYYPDCIEFDNWIEEFGVYNADTKIVYKNDGYQYVAYFNEHYNLSNDWEEVFAAASSAGMVSKGTSWNSSCCVCVYNNEVVVITTECCREMIDYYLAGYYTVENCLTYYTNWSYAYDREDTNW